MGKHLVWLRFQSLHSTFFFLIQKYQKENLRGNLSNLNTRLGGQIGKVHHFEEGLKELGMINLKERLREEIIKLSRREVLDLVCKTEKKLI